MGKRILFCLYLFSYNSLFSFESLFAIIKREYTQAEKKEVYSISEVITALHTTQKKLVIIYDSLKDITDKMESFSLIIFEFFATFNTLTDKVNFKGKSKNESFKNIDEQQIKIKALIHEIEDLTEALEAGEEVMPLNEVIINLKKIYNNLVDIKNELVNVRAYTQKIITCTENIPKKADELTILLDELLE